MGSGDGTSVTFAVVVVVMVGEEDCVEAGLLVYGDGLGDGLVGIVVGVGMKDGIMEDATRVVIEGVVVDNARVGELEDGVDDGDDDNDDGKKTPPLGICERLGQSDGDSVGTFNCLLKSLMTGAVSLTFRLQSFSLLPMGRPS